MKKKVSWHIFKYCPAIRLMVQRKAKKGLCLSESLWQWLIDCVDLMLDIVRCRRCIVVSFHDIYFLRNWFYSRLHVSAAFRYICDSGWAWEAPSDITTISTETEKNKMNSNTKIEFHANIEWSRNVPRLMTEFFLRQVCRKLTLS